MKRILIANRGEIARRVIRTAHDMGIETVAVFSEPDAGLPHVREATCAVPLGGTTSADSYLRVDKLLAAAQATGADAVHPGYGFLSENAEFAQAVIDAGLTWIGPPPAAIRALGSKAGAKELARRSQVPVLPGYDGEAQDEALLAQEAARIGYPVMIKATAGGGGRGMRLVTQAADFAAALRSAKSEAKAGFGDDRVLIERAVLSPRHVEVQVFADGHGHAIHLGERDCSVQRRHQKIIEEAPSPAVNAALRQRMGECAVALAQAAGYVGAGTVEFLVEEDAAAKGHPEQGTAPLGGSGPGEAGERRGHFYLMEMNTRLQVEHPVTEALTGLDLVAWQIRVARGEPLPWSQADVPDLSTRGHAIEVRLCAEDEQFAPRTGTVRELHWPSAAHFRLPAAAPGMPAGDGSALRIDSFIEPGTEITPHYDSMLGKLIVHAPTRDAAIDTLRAALQATRVLGVHTNRAFLAACLDHPSFRAGEALVPFLAQGGADTVREQLARDEAQALVSAAAALCADVADGAGASPAGSLACQYTRPLRVRHRDTTHAMGWHQARDGSVCIDTTAVDAQGQSSQVRWQLMPATGVQADFSGSMSQHVRKYRRHAADTRHVLFAGDRGVASVVAQAVGAGRWHVQTSDGAELWLDDLSLQPAKQGGAGGANAELRAPFNGKVIRVDAAPGDTLAAGAVVVVIESMKLEHALSVPAEVTVAEALVTVGQQVGPGQLLLRFAVPEAAAEGATAKTGNKPS